MSEGSVQYLIGDFVLDLERLELRQRDTCVYLRPKLLQILRLLVDNRHRVVTKQEIFDHVWSDLAVSDATLSTSIKELRQLFGDDGTCQRVIQTRRGAGFRFIAPVQVASSVVPAPPPPAASVAAGRHQTASTDHRRREESSAGARISAPEEPVPYSGVCDECKPVTVAVCGLSNSAELARAFGRDALHDLRRRNHDVMARVATRFDGTVQRALDSDVLLFGAPRALEDHRLRAVRAAMALQAALNAPAPSKPAVGFCAGIASGQVLVGPSGNRGVVFTPVGSVFEQAVALRNQAGAGQILLSGELRAALQSAVRVQPTGGGFELLEIAESAKLRAVSRARFIGRQRELSLLTDLYARAESGRGQVVGVVGEPGVGKTRLLSEFAQSIAPSAEHRACRCASYGQLTPFLPLAELVRNVCGIGAEEDRSLAAAKLEQRLDQPAGEAVGLLLDLLALDTSKRSAAMVPQLARARTLEALSALALTGATERPVLLEVEDLQWMDRSTAEWLGLVVKRLSHRRVMLLCSYRPGYRPPWLGRPFATQVSLQPLSRAEGAELLERPPGLGDC